MPGSATLAFSGQIFCDFAGYSTTAIGVGAVPRLRDAGQLPLPVCRGRVSRISGGAGTSRCRRWLRDYLYIPLGGNRHGPARTYTALMATMLLGGLWHGASWTFVAWGGLHGLYLVGERALRQRFAATARDRSCCRGARPAHLRAGQRHLGVLPRQDLRQGVDACCAACSAQNAGGQPILPTRAPDRGRPRSSAASCSRTG